MGSRIGTDKRPGSHAFPILILELCRRADFRLLLADSRFDLLPTIGSLSLLGRTHRS